MGTTDSPVTIARNSRLRHARGAASVGTALKQPRFLESILDRPGIAAGEVSDHHHVLGVPSRHAEGGGMLPQYQVALVEVGADDNMRVV